MNPYVDPASGVMFNKLGLTDPKQLERVEYAITAVRIQELKLAPVGGEFDLAHLKTVHQRLFGDIYEWAGQQRTVNFSKRDIKEPWWKSKFADHSRIDELMTAAAEQAKVAGSVKGLGHEAFIAELTKFYVVVNHAHPFPEGNGRSTQTLVGQLARESGYDVRFDAVDRQRWNHAAARSMPQHNVRETALTRPADAKLIHEVFRDITLPRERDRGLER